MDIRKFWITNGNEQTIQFADSISKIFINNPTGLGVSNTLETYQYADRIKITSKEQNFQQIGGEFLFYDVANKDKYEQYNNFITFLTHKPLMFYYQIPTEPTKTYSCEVEVLSVEKTEVKTDGALRCNFSLQQLTRWLGDEVVISGTGNTYTIENAGHMPVGFQITIEGSLLDPYFTLSQNNEMYGEAKFDYTSELSSVYVNSVDLEQNVILIRNGTVLANPLSYQDLSISNGSIYVTFIKLARGISTLNIGYESGNITSVDIKFTPEYRSV